MKGEPLHIAFPEAALHVNDVVAYDMTGRSVDAPFTIHPNGLSIATDAVSVGVNVVTVQDHNKVRYSFRVIVAQ